MKNNLMPKEQSWEEVIKGLEDVLNFSEPIWNGWIKASEAERNNVKFFLLQTLSDRDSYWLKKIEEEIEKAVMTFINSDITEEWRKYRGDKTYREFVISAIKKRLLKPL